MKIKKSGVLSHSRALARISNHAFIGSVENRLCMLKL